MKCDVCDAKIPGTIPDVDLINCPSCGNQTPTGNEDRIRKQLEKNRSDLAYPRAAVGRAIGYAAGIYALSTDNTRIDTSTIESKLEKKYGATSRADHTSLGTMSGRSYGGLVDERAGLMIYTVSGKNYKAGGRAGQEWTMVYVVFRGSRGDHLGSTTLRGKQLNEYGAGWDTSTGQARNVDWRANFDTRQVPTPWAASPILVHNGFLEIYCSVRDIVHKEVTKNVQKHRGAAVVVTGHSLGAALAIVCSHDLQCSGICEPFCLPFCAPRAGNLHFARDFNTKIASQTGVLWREVDGLSFHRSFIFVQGNDPVSIGGKHGFKNPMSAKSAAQVADKGSTATRGIYAGIKKTQSKTAIYYHVPNMRRASFFGMHEYDAMEKVLLG